MNEKETYHYRQDERQYNKFHHYHKHFWTRIHHTWSFWIFLFLMLGGILYYIMSVDFAFAPHKQMENSMGNSKTTR